ncbi:prephenate/arogenate dehydrogenase [Anthocerotibacter panamensis]|uniref:prephenate/arogenate dehydrogenase n=1 Tax=Anthocerotibacter panamensis TaxID=2857077 RepID=UPI001C402E31|nr:prephenate/arogenate dehydrogenase [Anthocerotibacter panamensis]
MQEFPIVGIVGLGLIGGSLGLDLTRLGYRVLGVSRHSATCSAACRLGMAHLASTDWRILTRAEIVFTCVPIDQTLPSIEHLAQLLPPGVVITDVASVKEALVAPATQYWPWFVGGHPMAGGAQQGIQAAVPRLFQGRPYVLTPIAQTKSHALALVESVVQRLEPHLLHCDPRAHDQAVALISHTPVYVSAALVLAAGHTEPETRQLAQQLASTGFADTSRVGGGNPQLGLQMARYNRVHLLTHLQQYQRHLDQLKAALLAEDWPQVEHLLARAHDTRPGFVQARGIISPD